MARAPKPNFNFEISLSVLNHLGRNLYRNSITVLGEAISNSWDADAKNVWINFDQDSGSFSIKDDGTGMDADDFQNKFLKIGYTKRTAGRMKTPGKRPFIGAKGIGKLALLSCAKRITIFSKKKGKDYIGGTIDNSGLDKAIRRDLTPDQYPLEAPNPELLNSLSKDHQSGTIIVFEETKEQIRSSIAHIRKMLALYFRFSILDKNFSIYVNNEKVGLDDLTDLLEKTQFVWIINKYEDEFVKDLSQLKKKPLKLTTALPIRGFIASVVLPRHLKITGTDERATIDLFVNGRLREKNILRHIPTQRVIESYLYGQIHFDKMDKKGNDPFTSSREGIVDGDEDFAALLRYLKDEAIPAVFDKWDELRVQLGEEGDEENARKSKKQRKARDLYTIAREEYSPDASSPRRDVVDGWLDELRDDAEFNIGSYVDCFLSENLARRYIAERKLPLSQRTKSEASDWREREAKRKTRANLSYAIRKNDKDIDYLGMDDLAFTVEGKTGSTGEKSLTHDAIEYAPVRNVVGHTGLLTSNGKSLLSLKYENIKARVKTLVSEKPPAKKKGDAKKRARRK
jgi:hypothetical protein